MKPVTASLLRMPASLMAQRLAFVQVAAADKARRRILRDDEALHRFRVAIRRLRSVLRAYKAELDTVKKKHRNGLRELCEATGAARDAEVQLAWLHLNLPNLSGARRPGAAWLQEQIEAEKLSADRQLRRDVAPRFRHLRRQLARALAEGMARADPNGGFPPGKTGAKSTARLLRLNAAALAARLEPVRGSAGADDAHQARIACKRLRYLIEPLVDQFQEAGEAVHALERMQDLLGEMHDADVLAQRVTRELDAAAQGHPQSFAARGGPGAGRRRHDPRIGLLEIGERLRAQRAAARGRLNRLWNRRAAALFFKRIRGLAMQVEVGTAAKQRVTPKVRAPGVRTKS
jgi:CHAD domain-containing protein